MLVIELEYHLWICCVSYETYCIMIPCTKLSSFILISLYTTPPTPQKTFYVHKRWIISLCKTLLNIEVNLLSQHKAGVQNHWQWNQKIQWIQKILLSMVLDFLCIPDIGNMRHYASRFRKLWLLLPGAVKNKHKIEWP